MGNDPSLMYYALVLLTVFNVLSLLVWFSITNIIRVTSKSVTKLDPTTGAGITSISGTGDSRGGTIKFTTSITPPSKANITVTLPYTVSNYEVALISLTSSDSSGTHNATSLTYDIIDKGTSSFTFQNGFPLNIATTYTLIYIIVQV